MEEALKEAIKLIEKTPNGYYNKDEYTPIYMFTTENIKGIINNVDLNNKTILTVSASGDQIFNMLLSGGIVKDTFDINYFTKYYFYLKESAIRTLDYHEFINFFFKGKFNFKYLNDEFFLRILMNINDLDALKFWKTLYDRYGTKRLFTSNLFNMDERYDKNTYKYCNDYLRNSSNYEALQDILKSYNYSFIWANLFNDISNINNKYDIIYLSNILGKLSCNTELEYINKVKEIVSNIQNNLNDNGLISICYLYCYLDSYWDTLNNRNLNSKELRYLNFKEDYIYKDFNGISSLKSNLIKNKDCLMLKRKK